MPRRLFNRIMPSPETIRQHRALKILGDALHDGNLWHLNRHSASLAVFIGIFCAFIPLPFQMVLAAALAIAFRANLPVAIALVWISNPLTMPPMFYGGYRLGALIMDLPPRSFSIELSLQQWLEHISVVWKPLLLGSVICGLFFGGLAYSLVRIVWRQMVLHNWRKRCKERREKNGGLHQKSAAADGPDAAIKALERTSSAE